MTCRPVVCLTFVDCICFGPNPRFSLANFAVEKCARGCDVPPHITRHHFLFFLNECPRTEFGSQLVLTLGPEPADRISLV